MRKRKQNGKATGVLRMRIENNNISISHDKLSKRSPIGKRFKLDPPAFTVRDICIEFILFSMTNDILFCDVATVYH